MDYPNYVDAEMRELLDVMKTAVVPRAKRRACVRTNWHTPCYSDARFRVI